MILSVLKRAASIEEMLGRVKTYGSEAKHLEEQFSRLFAESSADSWRLLVEDLERLNTRETGTFDLYRPFKFYRGAS